jgi:hypothetical protein
MLIDLFGYFDRRVSKMKTFEIKKSLQELERIQRRLEKELKLKEAG